ncbi:MAG: hypothetical protein IKD76_03775 [Clostridia bacterium]|nr:hypothetical protein [Clostridia bacterium]
MEHNVLHFIFKKVTLLSGNPKNLFGDMQEIIEIFATPFSEFLELSVTF